MPLVAALAVLFASACSSAGTPTGTSDEDVWHEGTLRTNSGDVPIHYQVKNGLALMEGDIALKPAGVRGGLSPKSFTVGAGIYGDFSFPWPAGPIPFRFDASVSSSDPLRTLVPQAIAHYQLLTPLTFVFDATNTATDYLLFKTNTGTGCNSGIGYAGGEHDVNLDGACKTFDIVVHEMGHAIGLRHEQSRPDRDKYITIQYGNIQLARRYNFDFQLGAAVGAFDFTSVMLYASTTSDPTFAVDTTKPIITKTDGTAYPNPQNGKGLSDGDVAGVLTLYPFPSVAASAPAVTSVSPAFGPNVGGTSVVISGARFDTTGGTTITFGGIPATSVTCPTTRRCTAVAPPTTPAGTPQAVDVQVTASGLTSARVGADVFTYGAGPSCTSSFTCAGVAFGFPLAQVVCTGNVSFYELAGTPSQVLVGTGTTYTFYTNDVGVGAEACDPLTGSCTSIPTYEPNKDYCGSVSPPPPPSSCDLTAKPRKACRPGWRCCGSDGWQCGVCP